MANRLTKAQKDAIKVVAKGADISNYTLAGTLRMIEREHPGLVDICDPMGTYDGAGPLPYFGCIATAKGLKAARQ